MRGEQTGGRSIVERMLDDICGAERAVTAVVGGEGALPSAFPVSDLAAASVAAAGIAVAELLSTASDTRAPVVTVDRRLASMWFASSLRPDGWEPPPPWDPIAGDYRTADGWIRLHTNAPAHREAALSVLGVQADRDRVRVAVEAWDADELEVAVVSAGGCAARMRSIDEWRASDQGRAVRTEPLVAWTETGVAGEGRHAAVDPSRPLAGVRVLDLTRVLAGPVATRFLALLGADVLRIDPPEWDEPGVVPDVLLGKRSARLDLRLAPGRDRFLELLAGTDVLVSGYRPGALDGLGLGAAVRHDVRPGLIEVALDAYGWTGPWAGRRGFDSIVQMSAGIADAGMRHFGRDRPTPLPVQALDHATGYLMAGAAIRGLRTRLETGRGSAAALSLARTAELLLTRPESSSGVTPLRDEDADDVAPTIEHTGWGPARRLVPPVSIAGVGLRAELPARPLGGDPAVWEPGIAAARRVLNSGRRAEVRTEPDVLS